MKGQKRVLIVDDERGVAQTMSLMLETRGYDVNIAVSGEEAIQKASEKPDLILLDLILPDVEGFEVCRRLRESKSTRYIPIIIVSVKYLFEDKIEGLYLGADDYLTKPFEYEELFARIEAVMRRSLFFEETFEAKETLIIELKNIVKNELIYPFYQPIFFLKPFRLLGYEALSRPPATSILSNPDFLFKAALRFGLYFDLEMVAWKKAFESMPQAISGEKLFLNSNPYLIESPKFFKVKSVFEENNISPKNIVLEITERSAISNFSVFFDRLRLFRDYGLGIAIDDVGGGYASLESIIETKPQVVKLDGHISNNLRDDPLKRSLIKFVVAFCKENNIISVAEGVEKEEDLDILMKLGIDAAQGYLLCRPTPQPDLAAICRDIQSRLHIDTFTIDIPDQI